MTSVTALRIEHCGRCGDKSLHGPEGCIPCNKAPIVVPANLGATPEKCSTNRRPVGELTPHTKQPAITNRSLTPLQLSIAELFGDGLKLRDVAARLGIEKSKVNNHMQKAKDRLDVPSRAAVIAHVRAMKSKAGAT
jgi:DNA-binding CsgD family transcriptional regulator